MSEKPTKTTGGSGGASAPNKMRLYATWVDRTPSNCIPRLCSLTLTRLVILRPLGSDLASISIAVKMQSSKRTLRSNELVLPPSGTLDTPLDVTFCLQYPHFLKREGNKLHILLQRRKRYKNRTMLGFKTLAEGVIRMDQVLQRQVDMELEMLPTETGKEHSKDKSSHLHGHNNAGSPSGPVARLSIVQLSSTPVDQEHSSKADRDHDFSDDDDEIISSGEEEVADLSDSEPIRTKLPHTRHNLKQRFVSLLRRFRVPETEGGRGADLANPSDIQALFQELESLSCDEDSANEQDTMSISSTPKPSLRPFFSSSKSLLDSNPNNNSETEKFIDERTYSGGSDGNADICFTDPEAQSDPQTGSPPREQSATSRTTTSTNKGTGGDSNSEFSNLMQELSERKSKLFRSAASSAKKKNSLSVSSSDSPTVIQPETITARKIFLDHVARVLSPEETSLPDSVMLITGHDSLTGPLIARLGGHQHQRIFQPVSAVEVKTVLTAIFNKIHKYCNSCAKPGTFIKLILIGGDTLIGWVVRPYVELLSTKPPEWLNYTRIYVVPPLGGSGGSHHCGLTRRLAQLDQGYASLFPLMMMGTNDSQIQIQQQQMVQQVQQQQQQDVKIDDFILRLQRYLSVPASAPVAQIPIGEAMLTCQDETSQVFVPFVNEVRVGPAENYMCLSVDLDDLGCTSPPAPPPLTPPSSPNVQTRESPWEPLELHLDYWPQIPTTHHQQQQQTNKNQELLFSSLGGGSGGGASAGVGSGGVIMGGAMMGSGSGGGGNFGGNAPLIAKEGKQTKQEISGGGKTSLKGLFRGMQACPSAANGLNVTIHLASKEKKQKIMRLGKKKEKEKDTEPRTQNIEGISRLICSVRASHNTPLRVYIDGVEYNGVKFFQLSSTWQTHVKNLTVALVGVPLASIEVNSM